ncbi:transcriptional regulator domain-containing protein [Bradyrhizobium erythrophlei]|uniref:transcriptional regulator domain-containing protein n=1 Tax=Bradyrhizobium erythrophlei TaxID=1437360 RepID=UPI0035EF9D50
MPGFDWRSPESYKTLQDAEITDIAWERLRRSADYRRDYEAMIADGPDGEVTSEFRRRWGICFRHDPLRSFTADDLLGVRGSADRRAGRSGCAACR